VIFQRFRGIWEALYKLLNQAACYGLIKDVLGATSQCNCLDSVNTSRDTSYEFSLELSQRPNILVAGAFVLFSKQTLDSAGAGHIRQSQFIGICCSQFESKCGVAKQLLIAHAPVASSNLG